MKDSRDVLKDIFPVEENIFATGAVLTAPTLSMKSVAEETIRSIDFSVVLRDVGIIVAREICTELEGMGLKPSDYVSLEKMPEEVAKRLAKELAKAPSQFVETLLEQMRLRG